MRQRGFTLIETLIAMMIMTGGIVILATSWSGNVMRIKKARINNTVATLLQQKMTEIEIAYRDKPDQVPEEESGEFGTNYPGYTWELRSQEFEMPDLSDLLISREGGADETLLTIVRTVNSFINQSVREVSLTVVYKKGNLPALRNTVSTFLVDYSKELSIPGLGASGAPAGGGSGP